MNCTASGSGIFDGPFRDLFGNGYNEKSSTILNRILPAAIEHA